VTDPDPLATCPDHPHMYNTEHHHAGLGLLTPAVVHHGDAGLVRTERQAVLTAAYAAHPERFVHKPPTPPALPAAVWINAPGPTTLTVEARQ
jgi:putative transposase